MRSILWVCIPTSEVQVYVMSDMLFVALYSAPFVLVLDDNKNFHALFPSFFCWVWWKACQYAYSHFLFWITILRMEWDPWYECAFCLQEHDYIPCDMKSAIHMFVGWYVCSISSVVSVFVCNDIINEIEEIYKPTNVRSRFVVLCSILCTEIIRMHVSFTYWICYIPLLE